MKSQRMIHQTLKKSLKCESWRTKQKAEQLSRLFAFNVHNALDQQPNLFTKSALIHASPTHVYGAYRKIQQKSQQSFNNDGEQEY